MKPKINTIAKEVKCEDIVFEDIPSLKACELSYNVAAFDATAFCEENKLTDIPYHIFYSACQRYIDTKLKNDGIELPEVFYQNTDGHLLIHISLVIIYLQYAMPDYCVYFNNIVANCLMSGIAFSDSFTVRLAANNIPDEVLQEIISQRKQQQNEQQ